MNQIKTNLNISQYPKQNGKTSVYILPISNQVVMESKTKHK